MKVALASTSAVKLNACQKAFADMSGVEIVTVKAASGVAEQPIGQETLNGAFNRINATKEAIPDADVYVSIENGIFEEAGKYVDRAVVVMSQKGGEPQVAYSDGVAFPEAAVEETRRRGFDQWTVGKIMQEQGIVTKHDDPHLDLSGKSRVAYIDDAMPIAVASLKL